MISSTNSRGKTIPFKRRQQDTEPRVKKRVKRRLQLKLPLLVMLLVIVYMAFSLVGEMKKLEAMKQNVQQIEQQMEQLQSKNAELHKTLDMLQSNDYVEQAARESLGLVKPGESLIIPVEKQTEGP